MHLIRNSLDFVSSKNRRPVVAELRKVYRAKDAETGRKALEDFSAERGSALRGRHVTHVTALDLDRRHSSSATGSGSTCTPTYREASSP